MSGVLVLTRAVWDEMDRLCKSGSTVAQYAVLDPQDPTRVVGLVPAGRSEPVERVVALQDRWLGRLPPMDPPL